MAFRPLSGVKETAAAGGLLAKEQDRIVKQTAEEVISLEEEKVYREGVVSIRDLIAPSAFNVESSFLKLGDIFVGLYLW